MRRESLTTGGYGWTTCLVIAMLVLAGCTTDTSGDTQPSDQTTVPGQTTTTTGDPGEEDPGEGDTGGVLTEAGTIEPANLNPSFVSDTRTGMLQGLLFDGLLGLTAEGELIPLLAEDLPAVSEEGTTYTFTLREGITWSDGQPVTAEDVVFTYELQYLPEYEEITSFARGSLSAIVENVSAEDERTVVFELSEPSVPFLAQHGLWPVVPKHVLGDLTAAEINESDFNENPTVTNGQFRFVEWVRGSHLVLEANPDYYLGRPNIDQYVYRIAGDMSAIAAQIEVGEVDLAQIDAQVFDQLDELGDVNVITFAPPAVEAFRFMVDPEDPLGRFFRDVQVRQAVAYTIDRQVLADVAYGELAEVAYSNQPPTAAWFNPDLERYDVDLAKAESLLDEAGWQLEEGATVRSKDGEEFNFELLVKGDNDQDVRAAQLIQDDLAQVGITTTIRTMDTNAVVDQLLNQRQFNAMLEGNRWFSDPTQAIVWSCEARVEGGINGGQYCNPELDELVASADRETDPERRWEMYFEEQEIMRHDLPQLPTVVKLALWAANERVDGLDGLGGYSADRSRPWMKDVSISN